MIKRSASVERSSEVGSAPFGDVHAQPKSRQTQELPTGRVAFDKSGYGRIVPENIATTSSETETQLASEIRIVLSTADRILDHVEKGQSLTNIRSRAEIAYVELGSYYDRLSALHHRQNKNPAIEDGLKHISDTVSKIENLCISSYNTSVEDDGLFRYVVKCLEKSNSDSKSVAADLVNNIANYFALDVKKTLASIPKSAPDGEFYKNRADKQESAPEFIERVYGSKGMLTGEFTRADLRRVDPQAYMGLSNWERKNGRADINLPTLKEANDRAIAERTPADLEREREANRLRKARERRSSPRSSLT